MELYGGPSWCASRVTILIILVHQSGKGYSYDAPYTGLGYWKVIQFWHLWVAPKCTAFCRIRLEFVGQLPCLVASRVPAYLTNWALCPYGKLPDSCTLNPSQYPSINRLQYPPLKNSLAMPTHIFYKESSVVKIDHIRYKAFSKQWRCSHMDLPMGCFVGSQAMPASGRICCDYHYLVFECQYRSVV